MVEPLSFAIAKDWLGKLYQELTRLRTVRSEEIVRLSDKFANPEELAKHYIEPDCQQFNPADENEDESPIVMREPMLQKLQQYIAANNNYSKRQMFILSDAGMGKTSTLLMLKLAHLTAFWPKNYECVLLKLESSTLDDIKAITNKPSTVLLLDALDEDPLAWNRILDRITELLTETQSFKRVLITCRTQFFSGGTDPFNRKGQVQVGDFICPVIYNSFFSDDQVGAYLDRRARLQQDFVNWTRRALEIVGSMGSLRMRPMLLSHIDDFLEAEEATWNHYTVYRALVTVWLQRERRKPRAPGQPHPELEDLRRACRLIALHMHEKGIRTIQPGELNRLTSKHAVVGNIHSMNIGGRSLLNRDSLGNYRFSHYSVQEFLVADAVFEGEISIDRGSFRSTDEMKNFFASWIAVTPRDRRTTAHASLLPLDRTSFVGQFLEGMNFEGMNLDGTNFSDTNLRGANFDRCSLVGASFRRANLDGVSMRDATATNADFSFSRMTDSQLQGSMFEGSDLRLADLSNAEYDHRTFWAADVHPLQRGARIARNSSPPQSEA